MRKQKSQIINSCNCKDYEQEIMTCKTTLIQNIPTQQNIQPFTTNRLLKIYMSIVRQKNKYYDHIQNVLRTYIKQQPTIIYNDSDDTLVMVDSLINKMKKQRQIHHIVIEQEKQTAKAQSKERTQLKQEIDYLKELLKQEQKQLESWKHQAMRLEKHNLSLKRELEKRTTDNKQLIEMQQKLQLRVVGLERDKKQLSLQYVQKCEEVKELAQNFQSEKEQLAYKGKIQMLQQIKALKSQLSFQNPQTTKTSSHFKHNSLQLNRLTLFNHLFVGDVLYSQQQNRYFLIDTLQTHMKNAINHTRLLYRWDPFNTANVHKYIDGVPNIVVVIRTEANHLIGAFSQGAFKHKAISNHQGLLLSFSNQKVYKNIKKAIIYDQNQIIFGHFQLKIKSGQNKLSSNFGLSGGFYEGKGESVNNLIGQNRNRQVRMKHYQIYSVVFQA